MIELENDCMSEWMNGGLFVWVQEVTEESTFINDLGADSLDIVG